MDKKQLRDPFFVFYDSRSGSTFLANTLTKHAKLAMPPETNFITKLIDNYKKKDIVNESDLQKAIDITLSDKKFSDWGVNGEEIIDELKEILPMDLAYFIKAILEIYRAKYVPQADYVGIKKNYIFYFPKLKKLFPDIKVVVLIRDGRAVFNSKKNSIYSVTGKPFETDPAKAARVWLDEVKKSNELAAKYPEVKKFYFEYLIKDTDKVVKEVLDFVGIPEDKEGASNYYEVQERYGKIHENIEKNPDPVKIVDFKNKLSKEEINIFEKIAGKYLKSEGYKLLTRDLSPFIIRQSKRPAKQLLWFILDRDMKNSAGFETGIDVACGDMFFYNYFRTNKYIAVDADAERLKKAQAKLKEEIVSKEQFIEDMNPEEIRGDFVTCIQTIGINNDFKTDHTVLAVEKLCGVTNEGGTLIFNIGDGSMQHAEEVEKVLNKNFRKVKKISYGKFEKETSNILSLLLAYGMFKLPFLRGKGFNYYYCEDKI
jgi:hypothetical protein